MIKKVLEKIWSAKPPPAQQGGVNYSLLDRFTFVHFVIGVGYGFLGFRFELALVLAFVWELLENSLKYYLPFIFPHSTADTLRNSIGDFLAVMLGWALSRYFITHALQSIG